MDLEISQCEKEGYTPLISSDSWRVAVVNSCEKLLEKNLAKIERHLLTDEVFVLLKGDAALFIGKEMKKYSLEPCKMYNVKRGVWHCVALLENSSVLVIENDSTSAENSEYCYFG